MDGSGTLALALTTGVMTAGTLAASYAALLLRRSRDNLVRRNRDLLDDSPLGILIMSVAGEPLYANQRLVELTGGAAPTGTEGLARALPLHPDDVEQVLSEWAVVSARREIYRGRFRILRADGEVRHLRLQAQPVVDGERLDAWIANVYDETGDIAQRDRLQQLSQIVEGVPDFVFTTDPDGYITYLNPSARRLLGIGPDEEVPHIDIAATLLTPVSQAKLAREALPAVAENDVWVGDMTVRLPHREMPVSLVLVAHRDDRGDIAFFSSISRDITERKQVEARLLQADLYDQLTGLPNRVLFLDRLDQALVRADHGHTRIAVMSLNIDRFKLVNDSYGHHAGDSLLVRAASRLSDVLRPGDTAARFGSDTFTVLCEEVTDEEQAGEIAQRFSAALSAPFDLDGDRVFLTVSIGITLSGSGAATAPTMLRDADAAMHLAKERGRARHEIYSESLRTFAVHRLRTGNDLHRALSEGEFRLVYQPEVSLDDGHITAVEALLRWHHPDRGLVPPAEFIPLAEETGLIEPIGLWVLETAAAQAALWRNARHDGGPLPVWVNLSPRQLANPSIVEQVATVLERKAVDPRQIGLEITESALLEDAEAAIRQMTALRSLGIRLAVDDFGTGYASLAYLKRLPIDAVKIDRAFVDGIGNDADDVAIVTAVIGMAKALRLVSIAEGTETREQVRALRDLGCGLAQGYFFTTPQPAQTVTRLLSSDRRGPMFPFDEKTTDAPPTPAPRPAPAEVREVIVPQSRP